MEMDEYERRQWLKDNVPSILPNTWAKYENDNVDDAFSDEKPVSLYAGPIKEFPV